MHIHDGHVGRAEQTRACANRKLRVRVFLQPRENITPGPRKLPTVYMYVSSYVYTVRHKFAVAPAVLRAHIIIFVYIYYTYGVRLRACALMILAK